MRESCGAFPEFTPWWGEIGPRIVDLLAPFREFHFYHPDQKGSAFMKVVLPALTGKGYEGMAIVDGGCLHESHSGWVT